MRASLYQVRIRHDRVAPMRHGFSYGHAMWLVDVDHLPRLPRWLRPLAAFRAEDHFGDPGRSLRANLDGFLALQDIDLEGGQVLLLTNARSLGYVFNPISVWWCFTPSAALRCVVAEVHNTYGERHCYLLPPTVVDGAQVAKEFYVSPFFPVDGSYDMRFSLPEDELRLAIGLRRGNRTVFSATVAGHRRTASARAVLSSAVRHPLTSWRVMALIRLQGIRLYLRRLPLLPRPAHQPQKGVQ